eukprot:gnl/MRDRNA2_/MRDRNA2_226761_c0_seq1.p1 gnl/MRDRNA2_/MRDRNA2_226761_c0~~gnl/MRDRNA2_/MRDRNA2_226761_c0_seq1.p1  ORF type:complete len:194 (-),score=29.56 gnl/MRDRNA2_/MRDRNA2_226761_c0_seq1:614-1114(-)
MKDTMPWVYAWFAGWMLGLIVGSLGEAIEILGLLGFIIMIAGCGIPCCCCQKIASHNQQQDEMIRRAIAELQPQCTGVNIQYKTVYTDCCNGDDGKPGRNIVFAPAVMLNPIGMVGQPVAVASTLAVQVPPGSQPGSQIQVQTPKGPMNVTVPQGVNPGDIFQVQY